MVLAQLAANPLMTADRVAVATAHSASNEKTFSVVAVDGRWASLRTAVDNLGTAMMEQRPQNPIGDDESVRQYEGQVAGPRSTATTQWDEFLNAYAQ